MDERHSAPQISSVASAKAAAREPGAARSMNSVVLSTRRQWRGLTMLLWLALCCPPVRGQELHALAGGQYTPGLHEATYAYLFEYLQNFNDYTYGTYTWLNEGHVTDHHRDGYSAQFWLRWPSPSRRFALSAGVGPYRYYDTTHLPGVGVTDAHGWGVIGSAAAYWYLRNPWVLEARYNYVHTTTSISTHTALIGFGYQFDQSGAAGPVWNTKRYDFYPQDQRLELTAMAGETVVNNFNSPRGLAWGADLRYRLTPYVDAIGTYLDEGDARVVKRKGAAGQLGLKREFLNHHADVGVAGGFYLARDSDYSGPPTNLLGVVTTHSQVLGLLTMTATYRAEAGFRVRAYWYRTLTTNGRDTDVVMLGLGWAL
jgi:hypothetical protein